MGTISVEIDKIKECLIDVNTGKEVKTIVTQIKRTTKKIYGCRCTFVCNCCR